MLPVSLIDAIEAVVGASDDRQGCINDLRGVLCSLSPQSDQPVDNVLWVPIDKVSPNDYNPNSVARIEMGLLLTSIRHDGYTQPVVTVYDAEADRYVIVDGFHRYFVMKSNKDVFERCNGLVPVVVINKDINDRMASTIRHNRARGKHSVQGMSSMVFDLLANGWEDAAICNELGMGPEELLRLKHITGFSKLFAEQEYTRSWVTDRQILIKKDFMEKEAARGENQNITPESGAVVPIPVPTTADSEANVPAQPADTDYTGPGS